MPRVTQKGQVTIPKDVRESLGIKPGSSVKFKVVEGKCVVEKEIKENKLEKWVGYLKSKKRTDELMKELRGEVDPRTNSSGVEE
ncbi:MAG TPA: AbrB/MazE/SpoVT family DNA-binding domain-containing protein [Thermodesulfobacteriota bacterium]|nr:AbrB/MazE/SpoVT family DNA-binding domain-containing protein [Thermodesulfobacteriota bacterium]